MANSAIPPYFSWVVDRLLAVSAHPYHHTHLRYLTEHGIHTVVTINDCNDPPFHTRPELKVLHMNIRSGSTPSLYDCQRFVSVMEEAKRRNEGVLIHSLKATGRAAVLVACFLVKLWESPADYVIDHLRIIRPVAIETSDQEKVVHQFHNSVAGNFEGYYSRTQTKWSKQTEFLGNDMNTFVDQPVSELFQQRIQN